MRQIQSFLRELTDLMQHQRLQQRELQHLLLKLIKRNLQTVHFWEARIHFIQEIPQQTFISRIAESKVTRIISSVTAMQYLMVVNSDFRLQHRFCRWLYHSTQAGYGNTVWLSFQKLYNNRKQ